MSADWKQAVAGLILAFAAIFWLNAEVIRFTVHIWTYNETYTHGYLIFPISAWLVWRKRSILAKMRPRPEYSGLLLMLLCSLAWQLGHQADTMVVEQYSMIGMLAASIWALLGRKISKQIAFPVFFLFLAVPIGEAFIPWLMDFTADFTVKALQLTGIPVFREGTFFSLPDGNWSVVEACSGLRYLISSLTLGILYAYLTYRSFIRKLVFIAISGIVPIFANGIRAYMIVMIGHLAGIKYATGIDHLIYGWLFFGLVMLLLFWIGSFFREPEEAAPEIVRETAEERQPASGFALNSVLLVAISGLCGIYSIALDKIIETPHPVMLSAPIIPGWESHPGPLYDWTPHFLGSKARLSIHFEKNALPVSLYIGYYRNQHQDAELVTSTNRLVESRDPVWGNIGEHSRRIRMNGEEIPLIQARLKSANHRLLVWSWYWIDGKWVSNPYLAKILEAESKMISRRDDAAVIVLAAPYSNTPDEAEKTIRAFLASSLPGIRKMLQGAAGEP